MRYVIQMTISSTKMPAKSYQKISKSLLYVDIAVILRFFSTGQVICTSNSNACIFISSSKDYDSISGANKEFCRKILRIKMQLDAKKRD